jgi:hypothetical protein
MAVCKICQTEIPLNVVVTAVVNFYESGLFNNSALGVIGTTAAKCVLFFCKLAGFEDLKDYQDIRNIYLSVQIDHGFLNPINSSKFTWLPCRVDKDIVPDGMSVNINK